MSDFARALRWAFRGEAVKALIDRETGLGAADEIDRLTRDLAEARAEIERLKADIDGALKCAAGEAAEVERLRAALQRLEHACDRLAGEREVGHTYVPATGELRKQLG